VEVPPPSDPSEAVTIIGDSSNISKAIEMVLSLVRGRMYATARWSLPDTRAPVAVAVAVAGGVQSKSVVFEEFPIAGERLQRYMAARGKSKLRDVEKDRKTTVTFTGTAIEAQGPSAEADAVFADLTKLVKALVRRCGAAEGWPASDHGVAACATACTDADRGGGAPRATRLPDRQGRPKLEEAQGRRRRRHYRAGRGRGRGHVFVGRRRGALSSRHRKAVMRAR
jgi:hypothetical protein